MILFIKRRKGELVPWFHFDFYCFKYLKRSYLVCWFMWCSIAMGCIYTEAKSYPREPAAHVAISEISLCFCNQLLFVRYLIFKLKIKTILSVLRLKKWWNVHQKDWDSLYVNHVFRCFICHFLNSAPSFVALIRNCTTVSWETER